jgi:hypothetical protein
MIFHLSLVVAALSAFALSTSAFVSTSKNGMWTWTFLLRRMIMIHDYHLRRCQTLEVAVDFRHCHGALTFRRVSFSKLLCHCHPYRIACSHCYQIQF